MARLADAAAIQLKKTPRVASADRIFLAFLRKAADSVSGVLLLQKAGLCHEAQGLVRSLFELRLSVDAFLEMFANNPKDAIIRVNDAMMVEKVKQVRASGYKGLSAMPGAPTPASLAATETAIAARYTKKDFEALRRNGFTGLTAEQRAARSGVSDVYHILYRNFSRNIHGTDFAELFLQDDPTLVTVKAADFFDTRDAVSADSAANCVGRIVSGINSVTGLGLEKRLRATERALVALRTSRGVR